MQKKFNNKYNDGCIKIFKFLELLYKDEADYNSVMKIFSDDFSASEDTKKECVILNKYLNTLKVFGIKIEKVNNRYIMYNAPFPTKFNLDDLKTIRYLSDYKEALPDGKLKRNLESMIKTLVSGFNSDTRKTFDSLKNLAISGFEFYYADIKDKIQYCETVCQDHFKVNVKYLLKNMEVSVAGNPKELIFDNKTVYMRVHKLPAHEDVDIPITAILSIDRLPTQKDTFEIQSPVVFKLKGRLAQIYKLKAGEVLLEKDEETGSITISNKSEPLDMLLKRLMRYDSSCLILTPKNVRARMLDIINNALKKYE